MLSQVKKFALVCSVAVMLASCADSATINQQAALSYRQEMGKVRTQGAIDTTRQPQNAFIKFLILCALMQIEKTKPG